MPDAVVLLMGLLVCVLPGLSALTALGLRRPILLAALAAPTTIAIAGLTASGAALVGLRYGLLALGIVTVVLVGVAVARLVVGRSSEHPRSRVTEYRTRALGVVLAAFGAVVGVLTWMRGIGPLSTVPQEHDMIVHTLLTSYISRTGRAAPWEVLPLDVTTGAPVYFYPDGVHLLSGALADLTGDAVTAINAVTVVLLAVVLSVSAAALTVVAGRRLGLGPGTAALAGGVASLVAAGLYRPTFQLAHDGGVLPSAAALAMTPAVVAGILLLPQLTRTASVGVGLACVGIVWAQPSAAVSVAVTVVAWWIGDALTRSGRRDIRNRPLNLVVVAATAVVLLLPLILSSAAAASRTSGFPADSGPSGFSVAIGSTLGLSYGGYLDASRSTGQIFAAAILVLGIVAVIRRGRGYGVVAAWLAWVGITIAYMLSPSTGPETIVTDFFYKAAQRVWSHVSLFVPVLGGIGIALFAARLAILLRRRVRGTPLRARWVAALLVVAAFLAYAAVPTRSYASKNVEAVASRYAKPDFVRVGPDDRAAAAWLAKHVQPGQAVLNSPNDGSTFLYVEYGIPIVNVYPLGLEQAAYSYELLKSFNQYPRDAAMRQTLTDLHVAWVYVDSSAPVIGAAGSPQNWAGDGLFSLAPGLENLDGLPGLDRVFTAGTVSVYSLQLATDLPQP